MTKLFYQDFLFKGIALDSSEYPDITLEYCDNQNDAPFYSKKLRLPMDSVKYSFKALLDSNTESAWIKMRHFAKNCKQVYIVDDLPIKNIEVQEYKDFYMKTYFYIFKQCCQACYIVH